MGTARERHSRRRELAGDKESTMSSNALRAGIAVLALVLGCVGASAAAVAATRFEETDLAVTLGAGWSADTSRPWSGGSAAVSAIPGVQASFTFTGSTVNWIGALRPDTGIARVYVD